MDRYRPPHEDLWQGRQDEGELQRLHQVIQMVDLNQPFPTLPAGTLAFIGFACDEGIKRNKGRPGANEGPHALRLMLAKTPLPLKSPAFIDAGNVLCIDNDLEKTQETLADAIAILLENNCIPCVLGGGHELAWGHYLGLKKAQKHRELTVLNFDAHYDVRPLIDGVYGSSGTSFAQMANNRTAENLPFHYVCIGIQDKGNTRSSGEAAQALNSTVITAEEVHTLPADTLKQKIEPLLSGTNEILLSICMDVFSAPYAPGVSAPQPLGLTPWQVIPLLQLISATGKVTSIEIAETSPPLDHDDMTSRLAANLISYLI